MGRLIYKKGVKLFLILLQPVAVGILVYCLLNLGFWFGDSYSLKEMARNFEESEVFFRQADGVVRHKIRGQQNDALFESDGELNLDKEIDIQSYGKSGSAVQDMNTTYRLGDLVEFGKNGGQQALHSAILEALQARNENRQAAGELLDGQTEKLETISPVTGISLSECSRWYSDSAGFVLDSYMRLDEVAEDIYSRYQEYEKQDETWSKEAPSNLRYCVVNSKTGELYTNVDADGYAEAVQQIQSDSRFTTIYEGERSFNIMVTNPDNVLNDEITQWFSDKRFVDTNEKVFLAVDREYPVSDILQIYAGYYAQRESISWISMIVALFAGAVAVFCLILSLLGAGWDEGRCTPKLRAVDRIPTELAAGLYMIVGVICLLFFLRWRKAPDDIFSGERIWVSIGAGAVWFVFLTALMGFVRRIRTKTLWTNSITRMLLLTWRRVNSARMATGELLFFYIIFFVLNFLFLLLFDKVGIFLVFVLDMAVLLYLLRDMAGKQSVWEGIHQISKGDLSYKIDTTALQGEALEMAKAVNEMGDGLQEAVDAIIKNERLKAELITNVSHDLKTPLTSIVNYVDLLKREKLEGERVNHYIEVLEQKSQRLRQLTEDLVEASKINSGNVELDMVRMVLQNMVQQAFGEFQERLEERGLTAVWEMDREPVCIMADGRHLWRVLENLFSNIYKYALEQTQIRITVQRDADTAILSISNTCREKLNIEADELMARFVRGDKSRNTEGSGLGLSIAQSLTKLQGGTFDILLQEDQFAARLTFPVASE